MSNLLNPPSQRTSTAYAVANLQCQPFHRIYVGAPIFFVQSFNYFFVKLGQFVISLKNYTMKFLYLPSKAKQHD
jgi:hypothetical protein